MVLLQESLSEASGAGALEIWVYNLQNGLIVFLTMVLERAVLIFCLPGSFLLSPYRIRRLRWRFEVRQGLLPDWNILGFFLCQLVT